jgi:hypothetical protein
MPYPYFFMNLPAALPPNPPAGEGSKTKTSPKKGLPSFKATGLKDIETLEEEHTLVALTNPSWILGKKLSLAEWLLAGGLLSVGIAFWNGTFCLGVTLAQKYSDPSNVANVSSMQNLQTFFLTTFLASFLTGFALFLGVGVASLCNPKTHPKN